MILDCILLHFQPSLSGLVWCYFSIVVKQITANLVSNLKGYALIISQFGRSEIWGGSERFTAQDLAEIKI